jgi:hypothetical protein
LTKTALFICLGGTGQMVAMRLKKLIHDSLGDIPSVRFLVIDTAEALAPSTGELALEPSEFLTVNSFNADAILENLHLHPTIAAWLPENLKPGKVRGGAKQIRAIGRLALFWHSREIQERIAGAVTHLAELANRSFVAGNRQPAYGETSHGRLIQTQDGIDVFLVASLCGGTGSGMFLDTAYLTHQALASRGIEDVTTTGLLVLPGAFSNVRSPRIQANAYSALMELDEQMRRADFACAYPHASVSIKRKPFDLCYLVDSVNERGRNLGGVSDVAALAAQALYLQVATPLGREVAAQLDNIALRLNEGSARPTAYSGLAVASLVMPTERLLNALRFRLAQEILGEILRPSADRTTDPGAEAAAFLAGARLRSIDGHSLPLAGNLQRDKDGRLLHVALNPNDFDELPAQRQALQIRRVRSRLAHQDQPTFTKAIGVRKDEIIRATSQSLSLEVAAMASDPSRGLKPAIAFLEGLTEAVRSTALALEEGLRERQAQREKLGREIDQKTRRLEHSYFPFAFWPLAGIWTRRRDGLVQSVEAEANLQIDLTVRAMGVEILSAVGSEALDLIGQLRSAEARATEAASRAKAARIQAELDCTESLFVLEPNVLDRPGLQGIYSETIKDIRLEARLFLSNKAPTLAQWSQWDPDRLLAALMSFCVGRIPTLTVSIEDILGLGADPAVLREKLNDLKTLAYPFWSYNRARLPNGGNLEEVFILSVPDKNASFLRGEMERRAENCTVISLGDPGRVTMYRARHGLPLSALTGLDVLCQHYERVREEALAPVHTTRDWENFVSRQKSQRLTEIVVEIEDLSAPGAESPVAATPPGREPPVAATPSGRESPVAATPPGAASSPVRSAGAAAVPSTT